MDQVQLIRELHRILGGIEGDRFTYENILELIEEIRKNGLKVDDRTHGGQ